MLQSARAPDLLRGNEARLLEDGDVLLHAGEGHGRAGNAEGPEPANRFEAFTVRDSGFEPLAFGFGVHAGASDGFAPVGTRSHPRDIAASGVRTASLPLAPAGLFTTPHGAPVVRKSVQSAAYLRVVKDGAQRLLTVPQVAERLSVSTATLYKLVERGDLEHVRVLNAIRISPTVLDAFIARGR